MALVQAIGIGVRDSAGNKKSITLYMLATEELADVQTAVNAFVTALDPVIDGKPESAQVTIQLSLPSVKADPVEGNVVHEGALLAYSAADTDYEFSTFIPSWEDAGFNGNEIDQTGAYATLQGEIASTFVDRQGNALDSLVHAKRAFRK